MSRRRVQKDKLAAFAKDLIDFASNAILVDLLLPSEMEALALWRDQLSRSSQALQAIFLAYEKLHTDPKRRSVRFDPDGELLLNCALTAAFAIGSRVSDSPIKARLVRESVTLATEAKKRKSRKADAVIEELALPIWTRYPKRSNNWIAEKIFNDASLKLKNQGLRALKVDALRKRIRNLRTNERPSD
jgi:hypothetical protein